MLVLFVQGQKKGKKESGLKFQVTAKEIQFDLIFISFCCWLCKTPTAKNFSLCARSHPSCGDESTLVSAKASNFYF